MYNPGMPREQPAHDTPPLWIEQGETRIAPLISAALLAPIDKIYTYTTDDETAATLHAGCRVMVPAGRKGTPRPAIVTAVDRGVWQVTVKPLAEIIDTGGYLSPHLVELGLWLARYYACPPGRTLAAMMPEAARRQRGFDIIRQVQLAGSLAELPPRLSGKQEAILARLSDRSAPEPVDELLAATNATRAILRGLIKRGLVIETISKVAPAVLNDETVPTDPGFDLSDAQRDAIAQLTAAIDTVAFRAFVLYGVSGSGKTEVYVHAMRHALAQGKQAIMLVPEIALTTQLVERLISRFSRVAVVHSGMTEVERSLTWESIRTGRARVVIGTRSAVFAPCPELGVIVVDEEQEGSYKNLQSPRFHVRDVAIKRAHLLGIPIILGSATPSLETWHNVHERKDYTRIDLPQRVRALPLPSVRLVPMSSDTPPAGGVSGQLHDALAATLDRGEQAIILINRRGYATYLFCPQCKRRIVCPRCNASMVLHLARRELRCHLCHTVMEIPTNCTDPSCQTRLIRGGGGTERLEEALLESFPQARIRRADSDSMRHSRDYEALVRDFANGSLDVLVGTQMLAKGLDFPRVTLVGVIGADLSGPGDFRASERLFQLVTQVAGRAGRADLPGRVLVQTTMPDLPALQYALKHDYAGFAAAELPARQRYAWPPYARLARIVLAGKTTGEVTQEAERMATTLRELAAEQPPSAAAAVIGPHPCLIERIRGQYRHELLLRAASAGALLAYLDAARGVDALKARVPSLMIDVDPIALS
jgi:primosomal protein N' (replication factor Y)